MPAESEINRRIAMFLVATLLKLSIAFDRLSLKTEVVVSSTRVSVRVPDLVVLSEEGVAALEGATRSLVLLDMPQRGRRDRWCCWICRRRCWWLRW